MNNTKFTYKGSLPDRNTSENIARTNRYASANLKRKYTDSVAWEAKAQNLPKASGKVLAKVTFFEKDNRKDSDNIYGGLKYLLDGLVNAQVLVNDNRRYLELMVMPVQTDRDNPRIEVELEEL